jgi:hypothetical protein
MYPVISPVDDLRATRVSGNRFFHDALHEVRMPKVFIGHSTQDREFVEREVAALLEGHGIDTWYAPSDIQSSEPGTRDEDCGLRGRRRS